MTPEFIGCLKMRCLPEVLSLNGTGPTLPLAHLLTPLSPAPLPRRPCCSFVLLAAARQLVPALLFVGRHPLALGYILLLSLVSTAVQLFIFYTIQQYGALHFALIMTLRQFLSIVLSCLVFNHDLSSPQWCAAALPCLLLFGLPCCSQQPPGLPAFWLACLLS